MNNYLPSKKFILIALSSLVVLVILFLLLNLGSSKKISFKNNRIPTASLEAVEFGDVIEADTDGDGLKDWEESLWGTDPFNPDTDNDGTLDGEEIEARRQELPSVQNGSEINGDLNETETFAREFFTTVIALQQSGGLTEESINDLSNSLSDSILSGDTPLSYALTDLTTVSSSSTNTSTYKEDLDTVRANYKNSNLGSELELLALAIQTGDKTVITQLQELGLAYVSFAKESKNISVPTAIQSTHLDLVNGALAIGASIEDMKQIFSNPVVGISGIARYRSSSDIFVSSAEKLNNYFAQNGIL
ncbi:hypothetical protein COB64_02065 [Candidatus Wolfebacteria bacterium]|nr:MAG: hypothetical protein COB64_02065 [Candidatus Wolfebacteria bacterium]